MSFTTSLFTTGWRHEVGFIPAVGLHSSLRAGLVIYHAPHSGNVNNHNGGEQPVCIAEAGEAVLLGRSDYRISFLPTEQVRDSCLLVSRSQLL